MKKTHFLLLALVIAFSSLALAPKKHFKDGIYKGESQSKYAAEPYWGQVSLEIKNDTISSFTFLIIDKEKNEVFGPDYEKHFKDNALYVDQCRHEVKGIKTYTDAFIKQKNMAQVDAITGATWSYNLFKDALNAALEKAYEK